MEGQGGGEAQGGLWPKKQMSMAYLQESIGGLGRQYKTKKASTKERYKVAQNLHERLKRILEDVSPSLPRLKETGGRCDDHSFLRFLVKKWCFT
jgi:hypothetical protein